MKFKKKPVVVEAIQFTQESKDRAYRWASELQNNIQPTFESGMPALIVPTLEGEMICSLNDWLIREPFPTDWRKVYPCKPDIFAATYEPA